MDYIKLGREGLLKQVQDYYLFHELTGFCTESSKTVKIRIDNAQGRAHVCVERLAEYIDELLHEVKDGIMVPKQGSFRVVDNGEGPEIEEVYHPAQPNDIVRLFIGEECYCIDLTEDEQEEYRKWKEIRPKLIAAERVRIRIGYADENGVDVSNGDCGPFMILDDLMADGAMEDDVTMTLYATYPHWESDEDASLYSMCAASLFMKGMHNGIYVSGEMPFDATEEEIRAVGAWIQRADENEDTLDDAYITVDVDAPKTTLDRVREAGVKLKKDFECDVQYMLNEREFNNSMEISDVTCADNRVDEYLLNEKDMRQFFSRQEIEAILNTYPKMTNIAVRLAKPDYSEDALEKVRFNTALRLINNYHDRPDMQKLINERLHAKELDNFNIRNNDIQILGELTEDEICVLYKLMEGGYRMSFRYMRLNGIEDVRRLCTELDELGALADELKNSTAKRGLKYRMVEKRPLLMNFIWPLTGRLTSDESEFEKDGERAEAMFDDSTLTMREYREQWNECKEYCVAPNCLAEKPIYFEVDDPSTVHARLRFVRKGDHFVAQAAIENMDF